MYIYIYIIYIHIYIYIYYIYIYYIYIYRERDRDRDRDRDRERQRGINTHIHPQRSMSIVKRLSSLSTSKEIFEETAPYHEQYLSNCRHKEKLNYRNPTSLNI